jgi:hypothetical protein
MGDTLDTVKDTASNLMKATGVTQMGGAMSRIGSAAEGVGASIGKGLKSAKDYAASKIAKPAARTSDIALPKEPKRKLSRGRR